MVKGPGYLIKCDCDHCNCENATPDGVCYECTSGLHKAEREWRKKQEPKKKGTE